VLTFLCGHVAIKLLDNIWYCFYHLQIRFHPNDHSEIKELADEIKNFEGIQHESLVKYYGVELHRVN
jgi:hypothetical protein